MRIRLDLRNALIYTLAILGVTAMHPVAQDGRDGFSGWYVGGNSGVSFGSFDVGGYTDTVSNASDIFVAGRGIIVVPAFTTDVAASHSGDLPDFHLTPCHYGTGTPLCIDEQQTYASQAKSVASFLGGLHVGYNKRSHDFLYGGELELGGSTFQASSQVIQLLPNTALTGAGQPTAMPAVATFTRTASSLWSSTLTVRIGGIWKSTLVYGLGGPILADMELKSRDTYFQTLSDGSNPCPCPPGTGDAAASVGTPTITVIGEKSENAIQFGWTAGAGIEHPIWKRWNLAGEYRHSQIGGDFPGTLSDGSVPDGLGGTNGFAGGMSVPTTPMHFREDRFSGRINYHY